MVSSNTSDANVMKTARALRAYICEVTFQFGKFHSPFFGGVVGWRLGQNLFDMPEREGFKLSSLSL